MSAPNDSPDTSIQCANGRHLACPGLIHPEHWEKNADCACLCHQEVKDRARQGATITLLEADRPSDDADDVDWRNLPEAECLQCSLHRSLHCEGVYLYTPRPDEPQGGPFLVICKTEYARRSEMDKPKLEPEREHQLYADMPAGPAPKLVKWIQDGWLCPRCDIIVAPAYRRCEWCGPQETAVEPE